MAKREVKKPPSQPEKLSVKLDFKLDKLQNKYLDSLNRFQVVSVDAPSGTGKTTIAVYSFIKNLLSGECDRVVYLRFVDERYLSQGYHKGTIEEKESKLFAPFIDALKEIGLTTNQIKKLVEEEKIIMTTDTSLRGKNFHVGTNLILDESQNAKSRSDLQLVFTRIHDYKGKVALIGHSGQCDNKKIELTPVKKYTPFQAFVEHYSKEEYATECKLEANYRGRISLHADKINDTWNNL